MPIHDWSQVPDASFHDFHQSWLFCIKNTLNSGALPDGYFAHLERRMGPHQSDVLTLASPPPSDAANGHPGRSASPGGVAVATRRPQAIAHLSSAPTRRTTVVVRQTASGRLVALLELASASNKDRPENVTAYVGKARAALHAGVHLVHLDLLPPTRFTPVGLGGAIWAAVDGEDYPFTADKPLAADAILSSRVFDLYANPLAVGDELPDVPLFLSEETYIPLPLGRTYAEAFASIAPQDRLLLTRPA